MLETRETIKIESHPFYQIICDWFSWEWSRCFFFQKKSQMADSKNRSFSKLPILNIFFKNLRSLVQGVVWGFEQLDVLGLTVNLSNSLCNFTRNNSYCWAGQQQRPFVIIGFAITFVSIITLYSESIRNRNKGSILVSVSEPKLFFLKLKLFFSNFPPLLFGL